MQQFLEEEKNAGSCLFCHKNWRHWPALIKLRNSYDIQCNFLGRRGDKCIARGSSGGGKNGEGMRKSLFWLNARLPQNYRDCPGFRTRPGHDVKAGRKWTKLSVLSFQAAEDKSGARKSALNMTAEDARKKAAADEVSIRFFYSRIAYFWRKPEIVFIRQITGSCEAKSTSVGYCQLSSEQIQATWNQGGADNVSLLRTFSAIFL